MFGVRSIKERNVSENAQTAGKFVFSLVLELTGEVANDAYSDAFAIEVLGMSACLAPAAAFVDVAVFADYEIIADVGPPFCVHVIVLQIRFDDYYMKYITEKIITTKFL